jgi:hypothetical protein
MTLEIQVLVGTGRKMLLGYFMLNIFMIVLKKYFEMNYGSAIYKGISLQKKIDEHEINKFHGNLSRL